MNGEIMIQIIDTIGTLIIFAMGFVAGVIFARKR
jgi:cbb3-type cytochrome oxidase subunit 3